MILKNPLLYVLISIFLVINGNLNASTQDSEENAMTTIKEDVKLATKAAVKKAKTGAQAVKEKTVQGAHFLKEKVSEGAGAVADKAHKVATTAKEKVSHAGSKIKERASDKADLAETQTIANWHKVKGKVREKWGRLTEKDLERIGGKLEHLYGTLQEKYGYTKAEAQEAYRKAKEEWNQ